VLFNSFVSDTVLSGSMTAITYPAAGGGSIRTVRPARRDWPGLTGIRRVEPNNVAEGLTLSPL
jgi:hypothetical protein